MKWVTDFLSGANAVLLAPLANTICVSGLVALCMSFVSYDRVSGVSLHASFHWPAFLIGAALLLVGLGIHFRTPHSRPKSSHLDFHKGVAMAQGKLSIEIRVGEIQSLESASENAAIVLPANTAFLDDCVLDQRSAMGAYFLSRFPGEIENLSAVCKSALERQVPSRRDGDSWPAGTTITLPDRFSKPSRTILTASSERTSGEGIVSNPSMICACIEGVYRATADQRVDSLYLPIIGSGHGGVEHGTALLFMVMSILHYSRTYHHVRRVDILIHPNDIESLNGSEVLKQIVQL